MKKYKGENYFDEKYHQIVKAIDENNISAINLLVDNTNLNTKGKGNLTFIFYAYLNDDKESFMYLLSKRPDVNIPFEEEAGDSTHLINLATESDDDFYFEKLVTIANLNLKDERGSSPLHNAIYVGNPDRLFKLIENKANINCQDKKSQTPLYLLCALNKFELAYQLIQKGADAKIQNSMGSSVALLIQEGKFPVTSDSYKWQQKIRSKLVNQGIKFPVRRPWEK